MKNTFMSAVICSSFILSACTATPTSDLNIYHPRVVEITKYDTSIVATFCGTEAFNSLFIHEPIPKIYPVLKESKTYLGFKVGFINEFDREKYMRIEAISLSQVPEYKDCGQGKTYPYIYWFRFNVEKTPPYKESKKAGYMKAYEEFKAQIVNKRHIEIGVVQLSGFDGNDLVSKNTVFLPLTDEQYDTLLERMD